jgi:acetolactate synthase-1/2/3 large subunit
MGFAYSRRIDNRDELKQGLEDFISAEGPSFLEVVTDVDEMLYPRIPSGMGYKDMILGPHME